MLTRVSERLCEQLVDEDGRTVARFDLSSVDISTPIAKALLRANVAEYGHTSVETQKQCHRSTRKLILFLQEQGWARRKKLPRNTLVQFHEWLSAQGLRGATAQSHQNNIITVLRWCARNVPEVIGSDAVLAVRSFVREAPKIRPVLSAVDTRKLLSACYEGIQATEARIFSARALVANGGVDEDEFTRTLIDTLRYGRGAIPLQRDVVRAGANLSKRVALQGGLRVLRERIYLTVDDVIAFFLAIMTQTGGNPMSIIAMKMGCIFPHPLRSDLECLQWEKRRARGEQRVDFPAGKFWSASNLIRRILELNSDLRERTTRSQRECIFLAQSLNGGKPAVPNYQSLHNSLEVFLARHQLPSFDFKDLRKAYASAHFGRVGRSADAQLRLNHRSIRSTVMYTHAGEPGELHHSVIAKYQGELVRRATPALQRQVVQDATDDESIAATVFGFLCKDPFAGLDGVTPVGSRCGNFAGCSTCPGAIVPLDDEVVVARIVSAKIALERARSDAAKSGWSKRFSVLYADSLNVITTTILPAVTPNVMARAQALIDDDAIPRLE